MDRAAFYVSSVLRTSRFRMRFPERSGAVHALQFRCCGPDVPEDDMIDRKPLIDRYGQWIPENWPDKAHSDEQLRELVDCRPLERRRISVLPSRGRPGTAIAVPRVSSAPNGRTGRGTLSIRTGIRSSRPGWIWSGTRKAVLPPMCGAASFCLRNCLPRVRHGLRRGRCRSMWPMLRAVTERTGNRNGRRTRSRA